VECSPYFRLSKRGTENADYELRKLRRTVAPRRVEKLNGKDFWEWYWAFRAPAEKGGPERITDAKHMMKRVKALFTIGVMLRLPDCAELREILSLCRFPMPKSRKHAIEFHQVVRFIAMAHKLGYPEMALAQALQYELTTRQGDVIGKEEYKEEDRNELEWLGFRWDEIDGDLILVHVTNKTRRPAVHDLKAYELVCAELRRLPNLPRTGPMIINPKTGRAFKYEEYRRRWRIIAKAAEIPDELQNRDSRAGGITEARNAGADTHDIQQLAGHADIRTTALYIRDDLEANSRVAQARAAHRARKTRE
jgi:hypothetical protein